MEVGRLNCILRTKILTILISVHRKGVSGLVLISDMLKILVPAYSGFTALFAFIYK